MVDLETIPGEPETDVDDKVGHGLRSTQLVQSIFKDLELNIALGVVSEEVVVDAVSLEDVVYRRDVKQKENGT